MKAGDRVRTPDGPGVVTSVLTDEVWTHHRPTRTVYAIVQLDDETYRAMYPPSDLKEITMGTAEDKTGGLLIQPLDETTTEPEPTPDPEPEPDDDTTDDDDPTE